LGFNRVCEKVRWLKAIYVFQDVLLIHTLWSFRGCSKRILRERSGHLGVPQADTKPPTVPEPFALKTDQRALLHADAAEPAGNNGAAALLFEAQGGGGRLGVRSKNSKKMQPFALATETRG
jgi:hypothetical protein